MNETKNGKFYKVNKDHILYSDGDLIHGCSIFLIKYGKVQVKYRLKKGKELIMNIENGGIFGLFETLSGLTHRLTEVKFLQDSQIYCWKKDDFLLNASINPELGMKAIEFQSMLLRSLNLNMKQLG